MTEQLTIAMCGLYDMKCAPKDNTGVYAINEDGGILGPLYYWDEATRWMGEAHYSLDDGETPSISVRDLIGWVTTRELAEVSRQELLTLWGENA